MEHRHLLPDEIDQLLDGEVGFGVAPLQAHVEGCTHCRTELDKARTVVAELERLPHFAPSPLFATRVMSQVQVFEPWHVSAVNSVSRWLPRSRPARLLAATGAGGVAIAVSALAILATVRLDAFLFFLQMLGDRARRDVTAVVGDLVASAFGPSALAGIQRGGTVALFGASAFLVALVAAAFGLRALTVAARRRHS